MRKIIIAAITVDGKIAKHIGHNVDWTSKEDKEFFRSETKKARVVIFGAKTYEAMGRPMPDRLNIIMTKNPEKYKNKQPSSSDAIGFGRRQSAIASAGKQEDLLEFASEHPEVILDNLAKKGYTTVTIGGGSEIYSLFLQKKLVDEIYLTIVPKIFGQGINLFKEIDVDEVNLELVEVSKLGEGEILTKYKINYST